MDNPNNLEKRTLSIEKTFDAPRSLVWEAWTQPAHISHWWGPMGMKTLIKKHQLEEGGEWEYSIKMPDGKEFVSCGKFLKINHHELIETTADFIPMTEGVVLIVELYEQNESTRMVFKVVHPTKEYCKQQEEMGPYKGWGAVFDGLNQYIKQLTGQS